jgi:hypothetical protein
MQDPTSLADECESISRMIEVDLLRRSNSRIVPLWLILPLVAALIVLGLFVRADNEDPCAAYAASQTISDLRVMQEQRLAECRAAHADGGVP